MENQDLKATYNKIADSWHVDHQGDNWWQAGTDTFAGYLKPGQSVLDVGCGGGTKSRYLIDKGLKVTGVDFAENLLNIAKKEVPEATFKVMDINDLDKLEGSFDGIFMQAVLLHIPKKDAAGILRKAVQKLNSGGYLYIAVKEKIPGGLDEEIKTDNDYGYEYQRFFSYFSLEDFQEYFKNISLEMVYKDVMPPSRTARKSNWLQVIGQKV
jgi:2-polyprenyl-3-methyl-5-hydroxy-6-metoxy-1,4-benzoquinol methylase